jgi:mRNA interferase HicA
MKKRDLIKQLRAIAKAGDTDLEFIREGANHEVWSIGDKRLVIPRHREINEHTAKGIIKRAEEVATDGNE